MSDDARVTTTVTIGFFVLLGMCLIAYAGMKEEPVRPASVSGAADLSGPRWYDGMLPNMDGVYAIWYDRDSVLQWNRLSDTLVWRGDTLTGINTMIHPIFEEGSVYWQKRYPDSMEGWLQDEEGHYTIPCFWPTRRQ